MDRFSKLCLSPASDDNCLSKNDASIQVLYLNQRILSDFFQNENCWPVVLSVAIGDRLLLLGKIEINGNLISS